MTVHLFTAMVGTLLRTASAATAADTNVEHHQSNLSIRATSPSRDLSLPRNKVIIAHITFMIAGWMVVIPLGALLARYGRTYFKWLRYHRIVQLIGMIFVTVGFALAVTFHNLIPGFTHFSTPHGKLGLAIFVLGWAQSFLGQTGHLLFRSRQIRYLNYSHIILGITTFALAILQISWGFQEWRYKPPTWVPNVFYGWAGFIFLLYAFGFTLIPRERRSAAQAALDDDEEAAAAAAAAQAVRKGSVGSEQTLAPASDLDGSLAVEKKVSPA
ncbi:hypothetical protein OC861_005937 [Tilletia horrida]|nr:hypothetical protein OC861_005937 [Tilletia horrida]